MATVVIGGTTASGKSTLALRLAERTGGTIVNADSVQLYRDLPTLTARPSQSDMTRADHQLYGVLDAQESCSVAAWLDRIRAVVDRCLDIERTLIMVGGTGFYLKSLLHGLAPMPEIDRDVRRSIRESAVSSVELHGELCDIDPAMAKKLRPSDRQRIMRALEVKRSTSRSLLDWQAEPSVRLQLPEPIISVALLPQRDDVRSRIDERLAAMLESGLVSEISSFLSDLGERSSPLLKADGVAEFKAHILGEISLDEARLRTFNKVCRYAKRQRTFFRHQLPDFQQIEGFAEDVPANLFRSLCR